MKTLLLLSWLTAQAAPADETLTNAGVIELIRAGLSDNAIIRLIDSRDSAFDVSVQGLIALKQSGVSTSVIRSMLAASTRVAGIDDRPIPPPLLPEEQGVYWERPQGLQPLPVENVSLRGPRGFETDTGAIRDTRSPVALVPPVSFVIRTPDNVAPDEYVLVQLFIRKDRREFRTLTGSLWRGDGIERMAVPFESERLARHVYRVRVVALPKGEFGFVRPGSPLPITTAANRPESPAGLIVPDRPGTAHMSTAPAAGAIFTFGVR